MGLIYSITDLTDMRYPGDDRMTEYRNDLRAKIDNFEDPEWKASVMGKKQLRNIVSKALTNKSPALKGDLDHFH